MKSKRFEDSVSSRLLINVIDVVLLCVGFFLAHYAFLHTELNCVPMSDTQRYLVIAVLCYVPVAAFLPPVALRRVTGTDKIARDPTNALKGNVPLFPSAARTGIADDARIAAHRVVVNGMIDRAVTDAGLLHMAHNALKGV